MCYRLKIVHNIWTLIENISIDNENASEKMIGMIF